MTISFADCLPPDVVHPLPFSFTGQKAKYANSTQLMLAMPNAAGSRPLGICSRCSRALLACPRSARSAACRRRHPVTLRPLPAKAASRHRLVAVNDYRPPLSGLVQQLKFHHRPELGPALARLLLQRLLQRDDLPPVDALVGVPLWHRRRWRRGYNQCDELCRPLARWRGCVWHREGLTRQRAGAVQHSLNARQRRQNLKMPFSLNLPCRDSISLWWMMSSRPAAPSLRYPACFCETAPRRFRYGVCAVPCRPR
nr:DNA utilization protein GntX [Klebsiella pneumoniae]